MTVDNHLQYIKIGTCRKLNCIHRAYCDFSSSKRRSEYDRNNRRMPKITAFQARDGVIIRCKNYCEAYPMKIQGIARMMYTTDENNIDELKRRVATGLRAL
ncbi:hypothetical protein ACFLQV_01295 [Calditrichota bacterium]